MIFGQYHNVIVDGFRFVFVLNMTATKRLMDVIFMFSVRFRWLTQTSTILLTKINLTQNTRKTKLFDKQYKHHDKHAHTKQR